MENRLTCEEIEQLLEVDTKISISQSEINRLEIHIEGNPFSICACLWCAAKLNDKFRLALTNAATILQEEEEEEEE